MKIAWLPKTHRHEKIFGLDAFRGIAAMLVLLFHFWTIYWNEKPISLFGFDVTTPFAAGHIGVDMFFVISGFLVFLSLIRSSSIASYIHKRFWRIVPLAVFFTVSIFLINQDFSSLGIKNLITHLSFTQSFFFDTAKGLNPVMWTLTVEMLFYALLPILLWLGRRKLWHFWFFLLALTAANFFYRYWLIDFFAHWNAMERIFYSEQLWGRFDQFVLGIGLGNIWIFRDKIRLTLQKCSSIYILLGLVGFFVSVTLFAELGSSFRDSTFLQVFLHFFVGLSFALFLLGYLFTSRKIQQIFAPKFILFLGLISYSIYLWHFPVILQLHKHYPDPIWGAVFSIGGTIALSTLSFFLIEKPFLKKKHAGKIGF